MESKRDIVVSSAERTFDRHGFAATGMDRLTEAAGVSTRTLYKHVGSKSRLMVAVLEERSKRFFGGIPADSVDALFVGLAQWVAKEGSRGCLFLRAQGETGGEDLDVSAAVAAYRIQLHELIRRVVDHELGRDDEQIAIQVLLLFEGATSAVAYIGPEAVEQARQAAFTLMASSPLSTASERKV